MHRAAAAKEIIDKKVIGGVRVENPAFGTVDYVSPTDKGLFFNTRPEERDRVIFQADGGALARARSSQ